MLDKRDINALQQMDTLGRLAQEAGRQGARRLSNSICIKVEAEDGKVDLIARNEIATRFNFKDVMAVAVYTEVRGELPGNSFVLIPRDNALRIITGATGAKPDRPVSVSAFTSQIILKQIGECFSLNYFEGMAILLQRAIRPRITAPEVLFDSWELTLTNMVKRLPTASEQFYAFWLRFCCIIGDERCQGVHLYFVNKDLLNTALQ